MNSKRMLIWGALVILVALLGASSVTAFQGTAPLRQSGAPGQLNYQGFLLDPTTGDPVPDGDYTLTFAIYDDATSTAPSHRLWEETQTVSTQNGLFNVMLGATKSIDTTWLDGQDLWLGITVQGESEMTPRTQLVSVLYALNANDVRGADIHPDNVYASNGVQVASAGGDGVYVNSALDDGMHVNSAGFDGVHVGRAGNPSTTSSSTLHNGFEVAGAEGDGLHVGRADGDGVYVTSAGDDGVHVDGTGDNGVAVGIAINNGMYVYSAGKDGVSVRSAGNPSTMSSSTDHNGFEVAGAEGSGLYVGQADDHGVWVNSTNGDGMYVVSAGDDGASVGSAGDDGVYVYSTGNPSTMSSSTDHNGFEVAGAEGSGLYVGQADDHGVWVNSTNGDGMYVGEAGDEGVCVYSAGNPSTTSSSDLHNGFEVAGAEGNGLYVGRADGNGVSVNSAGDDGVFVALAGNPSTMNSSIYKSGFEVAGAEGDGLYVGRADLVGVYVSSAGVYAGHFNGDVNVTGHISKGSISFKIDHPLDPQNKYLYHSSVESPDMMNVYNGNVTLDAQGESWVELPAWFETLNRDYRYQLTPIGAPGPNLYVAQEVKDNRFQIAGGTPGMKVSWQVTGIRHDPYAEANRIQLEEEKPPDERGTYLHPQAYGQPETMGLAYKEAQARENRAPPPER